MTMEKENLDNGIIPDVTHQFKVGDSVTEPIWGTYKWKIDSMYQSSGKLRAKLVAIIGQYKEIEYGRTIIKDRIAICSEFVENLKPTLNCG